MTFKKSLQQLGIEEYAERIFNSNSHGELFHLDSYPILAKHLGKDAQSWFPAWFKEVVKMAEETWERPESVFQHIPQILQNSLDNR